MRACFGDMTRQLRWSARLRRVNRGCERTGEGGEAYRAVVDVSGKASAGCETLGRRAIPLTAESRAASPAALYRSYSVPALILTDPLLLIYPPSP